MAEGDVKRKLVAILSADVKGYSRLMGDDEMATVNTLKAYQDMMALLIEQHHGRVVDSPGDNLLAEFLSIVDAVACAVKIQEELKTRNSHLSESRRMEFRIGVNLGDVIEDGGRIYGDGVNIAARVEQLSDAGGVCVSGTAYDHIKNRLGQGFEYMGEQVVKNIKDPVRVYRVLLDPEAAGKLIYRDRKDAPGHKRRATFILVIVLLAAAAIFAIQQYYQRLGPRSQESSPEVAEESRPPKKPSISIAVLPFTNMSGDSQQEYLSDGITENIITGLSKVPRLLVIARNSTFTYKGKSVNIQQVGRELGAQYVLEGSVQKSEEKVRITAQLIDASSGQHQWAEKYDRNLTDLFALQDEITMKIITAMQVKLTSGERARVAAKGTDNLEAYLKLLQGIESFRGWRGGLEKGRGAAHEATDLNKVRGLAQEIIALDENYPGGYALLARVYLRDAMRKKGASKAEGIEKAYQLAKKIIDLDGSNADGHIILGTVHRLRNEDEKALAEMKKAVSLDPNSPEAVNALGRILIWSGDPQEALDMFQRAIRLDPVHAQKSYSDLVRTHRMMGQYEKALAVFEDLPPNLRGHMSLHLDLIACYTALGKKEEADTEVSKFIMKVPDFSLSRFSSRFPSKDEAGKAYFIDLLKRAGLPE